MPPSLSFLMSRRAAIDAVARRDLLHILLVAALHLTALALMASTEVAIVPKVFFLLTWGLLNFFWLALLRRPAVAAALSLALIVVLILLSRLKYDVIWMTASFVDVMVIDPDTVRFLLAIIPGLYATIALVLAIAVAALALLWWIDPIRVRFLTAAAGFVACLAAITTLAFAYPQEDWEAFYGDSFVSKFSRSGVTAVATLMTDGYLEADASVTERLRTVAGDDACQPAAKPPHIILVHDESSFDIRAVAGVKVPAGYGAHFRSFDGQQRGFVVEGAGGPSWYTEYNVLEGLSARSFGRFSYFVTRIAAGRVQRGLPKALRRCGYRTLSIYPAHGAFMGAKTFQASAGIQTFIDARALGAREIEPDGFYYDQAAQLIAREKGQSPLFMLVYLSANHYPWTYRWRPELAPEWRDLGNAPVVDEYLRRQTMSARDYAQFRARLEREFPGESFLLVRFGDHQPDFAASIIEPALPEAELARRLQGHDPRYFTTYYALDTINYRPKSVASALPTLEGPYLPLVVQEAAGLPLDASYAEQKRILERCRGTFYACAGGAEARRFNRLLIDAGLIKEL
jgi:Sulfatase